MNEQKSDARYTMGRNKEETERLILQSQLYGDLTQRFLKEAGIVRGMRILDVGSGAGDVALAAAELVGPEGEVVGVDVNEEIFNTGRERAKQSGFENITFIEGDARTLALEGQFDAVVGRLVLMYMSDPAEALRQLSTHLRSGGIMAFQELDFTALALNVHPNTPLINTINKWCIDVFQRSGAHIGMGLDLYSAFGDAGLPEPSIYLSAPAGGPEMWLGYEYITNSFRSMLPLIEDYGIATSEEVDIETLTERLRREVILSKRPIVLPLHVTAWAQLTN